MRIAVSRQPGAERDVSPLELFFDLVYVCAIGQLSHHLVEHVDLRTAVETVVLALAVFHAWYMVAWGANWLELDPLTVRLALVALMFASLLMSVAIDDALGDRAWLFVTGYLLLQIGRCAFLPSAPPAGRALRQRPRPGAARRRRMAGRLQAFRRRAGQRSDLVGGGHDRGRSPARTYSSNARSNSGHHA
jgi:hypothetical protein